jgi:hypothetical protein
MQNRNDIELSDRAGLHAMPLHRLADPRVVLLAVGLFGLAIDLFVRPLSWIGLALIVLAASPWLLQAWSQRSLPAVPAPRLQQGGGATGQDHRRPAPQPPAQDPLRRPPTAERSAGRPPAPPSAQGPERRPPAASPPQARPDPARTA